MSVFRTVAVVLLAIVFAPFNAMAVRGFVSCPPELVTASTYGLVVGLIASPSGSASRASWAGFAFALVGGAYACIGGWTGLLWYEDVYEVVLLAALLGSASAIAVHRLGLDRRLELFEWLGPPVRAYYGVTESPRRASPRRAAACARAGS